MWTLDVLTRFRRQQLVEPDSPAAGPAEEEALPRTLLHGVGLRIDSNLYSGSHSHFTSFLQTKIVILGFLKSSRMSKLGVLFGSGSLRRQICSVSDPEACKCPGYAAASLCFSHGSTSSPSLIRLLICVTWQSKSSTLRRVHVQREERKRRKAASES